MKWIIVIPSMNILGHSFIANTSWMDGNLGYDTLEACQGTLLNSKHFIRL